jgi:simple sugar transport system ATP-binding protein
MSQSGGGREEVLRVSGLHKKFGGLIALNGLDLVLGKGEILGLIGDNGAGKSTLVKTLSGLYRPDSGQIFIEGGEVSLRSVHDAREHGIETVYQDLALVNELSVYHNLFLNREHTRGGGLRILANRRMRAEARRYLAEIRVSIPDIDAEVEMLSGGQRQAIAVARATHGDAKILLLDEPLAAMGAKEGSLILDLVRSLADRGVSVIIVAHNYAHLLKLCDRVNVIEQGRITLDKKTADTSVEELTTLMVAELDEAELDDAGETVLP